MIGYYDQHGVLQTEDVVYTLSEDTALNASNEAVHYVDSITFSVDSRRETYALTLYINSNVMGVQFTQPNAAATAATYPATLTVDWSSIGFGAVPTAAEESAEATAPAENGKEEMDGLNLYRAGEGPESETTGSADTADGEALSRRAYLNPAVLIVMGIVGAAILLSALAAAFILPAGVLMPLPARAASVGASLSCFVNAMGGQEFGGVYDSAVITKTDDGETLLTVNFKTTPMNIYTIRFAAFVDADDPATIGFYDADADGSVTAGDAGHILRVSVGLGPKAEERTVRI